MTDEKCLLSWGIPGAWPRILVADVSSTPHAQALYFSVGGDV